MRAHRWCAFVLGVATIVRLSELRAADAPPETEGPCGPLLAHLETLMPDGVVTPNVYAGEGLTGYLQREGGEPRATLALASAACRAEVRSDRSGRVLRFVREALGRGGPGWVNVGRIVACATQDPTHLAAVPEWLADERHAEARAACFAALGTWPGAEAIRPAAFAHAVRKDASDWQVDRALLSVLARSDAGSPAMRDELASVLRVAADRRAGGFDALRMGICVPDGQSSRERAQICDETRAISEARWHEDRSRFRRWSIRLGATVPYAGTVALTYFTREDDLGLGLATGAGALAGLSLGLLLGAFAALADADPDYVEVSMVLAAAVLGTVGGFAAHAAVDDSPSWRAPVAAGALLIPLTIVWGSAHIW